MRDAQSVNAPSLLVVEDDSELSTSLMLYLESEGYDVELATDGTSGLEEATRLPGYDLIVLDARLPDRSGFQILRQARAEGVRTPVLMLTGLGDHEHRMRGFEMGADDYLTKPFATEELLARIEALLRREAQAIPEDGVFNVGGLTIDLAQQTVTRDGEPVQLTDLEYALLEYLLRRRGRTATREQILRDVWDLPAEVETRTIDRHVNALRDVMDGTDEQSWAIQSVYGIGYKLVGADPVQSAANA
ncbi:response regulator transcription factor [Salisaeta longa]|uniref:response regulator transcription factor n=1 Tax=Salisaeta longa TaxID=503170 RepID=UPI0003B4CC8A|nr:response regulator transcription factor [Salisaeta longa]